MSLEEREHLFNQARAAEYDLVEATRALCRAHRAIIQNPGCVSEETVAGRTRWITEAQAEYLHALKHVGDAHAAIESFLNRQLNP